MRDNIVESGKAIISCLAIDDIIKEAFNAIQTFFEPSILVVGLYNKERKGLDMFGIKEGDDVIYKRFENMSDKDLWSVHCFLSQKDILCDNNDQHPEKHFSNLLFSDTNTIRESFVYVPLTFRNESIGVLSVQNVKKNAFSQYHLDIIKNIATYLAIALVNAEIYARSETQKNDMKRLTTELEKARNYLETQVLRRTKEIEKQNAELLAQSEAIKEKSHKLEQINKELERLSLVARKTNNAIMIMDAVGNVLWINECFVRLYNYTYEEFIKIRGSNILQTSFNPDIRNALEKCITTKKAVYYDALNVKGNGKGVWTRTTLSPVIDDKGNITNLLTIDLDITLLKDAYSRIEQQQQDITNSMHYAFRIQKAVLPAVEELEEVCSEHFIIYRPCNIVSGDFYWWYKKDNKFVIAVADCTGHGVPGGFMSMLGISFLNEIVKSNSLASSAQILERLRNRVKSALKQTGRINETADGMDIALCIIDLENNKICFSGAFNPLLIYRKGQIIEYRGDKMPIGVYVRDDISFTDQEITLQKNDGFYLFSDGITDQFGGTDDRKFSAKRFKNLILKHGSKSMKEQMEVYNDSLDNWMGNYDHQVDDICLIGFKLL